MIVKILGMACIAASIIYYTLTIRSTYSERRCDHEQ